MTFAMPRRTGKKPSNSCRAKWIWNSRGGLTQQFKLQSIGRSCQGVREWPAQLIDDAKDIDSKWLEGIRRVGLTAGASAPEILVEPRERTSRFARLHEPARSRPHPRRRAVHATARKLTTIAPASK